MMPKFHKNPVGSRYIAASIGSSLKMLAKVLTPVLKSVQCEMRRKVNYEFKFKNTSGFWIADNSELIRENFSFISNGRGARNIDCYDFKTLYTNLPHVDLLDKMCSLIDIVFDSKNVDYVWVSENLKYVSWTKNFKANGHCLNRENVKDLLEYLLDNIYVEFRGKLYIDRLLEYLWDVIVRLF